MLIVMDHHSTSAQVKAVVRRIEEMGFTANPIPGYIPKQGMAHVWRELL